MQLVSRVLAAGLGSLALLYGSAGCELGEPSTPELANTANALRDQPAEQLLHRWRGQTAFLSSAGGLPGRYYTLARNAKVAAENAERDIERADIYRRDAARGLIITLNSYRGLQIIDVAQPDSPALVASVPLSQLPEEMYLRGKLAYVLLNDDTASASEPGALIQVFDLADPRAPRALAELPIAGWLAGSRLLTDDAGSAVLYVVSNRSVGALRLEAIEEEPGPRTVVTSIDVSRPAQPRIVAELEVPGTGYNTHVSADAVLLAGYDWSTDVTSIRYVDISDLGGAIALRGSIDLPGQLGWGERGDLQMDLHAGVLRVASQLRPMDGDDQPAIRIATIDVSSPDQLVELGKLEVGQGHRLLATRFSGTRAYLFHMVNVDPLEVIDLADPAQPRSMGLLRIDGWVNHIEVRGERLLALGVDDFETFRLAMILFDVSDPQAPTELARAAVGEGWASTDASYDLQAFSVVDELGLVMLPVSSGAWDEAGRYVDRAWLQLFSFDLAAGTIAARGEVEAVGGVRRAFSAGERAIAFGEQALRVIDIDDLDRPVVTGKLELAKRVADIAVVGGFGAALVDDGFGGSTATELRVVAVDDPDERRALGAVAVPGQPSRVFTLGRRHAVVVGADASGRGTRVTVVSLAKPAAPAIAGQLAVDTPESGEPPILRSIMPPFRYPSETALMVGEALVLVGSLWSDPVSLRVIDLRAPTAPALVATLALPGRAITDVKARGQRLYISSSRTLAPREPGPEPLPVEPGPIDGVDTQTFAPVEQTLIAHELIVVELSRPTAPRVSAPISVPGPYAGGITYGQGLLRREVIFTEDRFRAADGREQVRGLDKLWLRPELGIAVLLELAEIPEDAGELAVEGTRAAYVRYVHDDQQGGSYLEVIDTERMCRVARWNIPDADYAWLVTSSDDRVYLRVGWPEVSIVDLRWPRGPVEVARVAARGWYDGQVVTAGSRRVLLPAGLYGTHAVELAR